MVVAIDARPADLAFVQAVIEQEQQHGRTLPINALIILAKLKSVKRATLAELAAAVQVQDQDEARVAIEELVEAGLAQAHGTGRGRSYTMSAKLYRQLGQAPQHIRQTGFDAEQQRQMVLRFVKEHGTIKRADVMELCGLNGDQAKRLLAVLVSDGELVQRGQRRHTVYERP